MQTTIFLGAGAEVDLGLPSGADYLLDTYFTKKPDLYSALSRYYSIPQMTQSRLPPYRSEFLFNAFSSTFKQFLSKIGDDRTAELLGNISPEELREESDYTSEQRKILFDKLIVKRDKTLNENPSLRDWVLGGGYYGILESLFHSLLYPNANPALFWRLINYYWSAFFSIINPLIKMIDAQAADIESFYSYVLNHLDYVIGVLKSDDYWGLLNRDSYYYCARSLFNHVLTTNYTPFCSRVLKGSALGGDESPVYLSGSIDQFESAQDFDLYSPIDVTGDDRKVICPFPFLMTKSPVKPIVNAMQLKSFSKAVEILEHTDNLIVLGYSFCQDDAHIAALIRSYLKSDNQNHLVFFSFVGNNTPLETYEQLAHSLRVSVELLDNQCEILPIENCHSETFQNILSTI